MKNNYVNGYLLYLMRLTMREREEREKKRSWIGMTHHRGSREGGEMGR